MSIGRQTSAVKYLFPATACGLLMFGLLGCTQPVSTTADADLLGAWAGSIKAPGEAATGLMVVDMRIDRVALGEESGSLHYGSPRHCEIALAYSGQPDKGVYQFALNKSHGGYCDQLQDGHVDVKFVDTRRISFQVSTRSGASLDAGEMAKK